MGPEPIRKTEIIVGNPLVTSNQTTKVVLIETNDKDMNSSIQRLYREKFPKLINIKDFEVIEQITKIKSENDGTKLRKKIIEVHHDETIPDTWEKLQRIKEETLSDERVAIHHINTTPENLQKMTEMIFHKTNTKVAIYTTANKREAEKIKTTYGMIISDSEKA
ncbi:unnamed protein product [Psylliodes chrysocephalus]|uniref:Uncharacterized protein n=1 Tax=Psylliodes chrysocephalus TaxID=3402493 RepID=A0A9P0D1P4_9CUCU|nr:unnamed protein product [Psylliodes chrysocephala]